MNTIVTILMRLAFIMELIAFVVAVFVAGGNFAVGRKKVGVYCIFLAVCIAGLAYYCAPVLWK